MIHEFTFMAKYDPAFSVLQQKPRFWSIQSCTFTDDGHVHISPQLTAEIPSLVQCFMGCYSLCSCNCHSYGLSDKSLDMRCLYLKITVSVAIDPSQIKLVHAKDPPPAKWLLGSL